jgi:hypothetical protein
VPVVMARLSTLSAYVTLICAAGVIAHYVLKVI